MDKNVFNLTGLFESEEICDHFADPTSLVENIKEYFNIVSQRQNFLKTRSGTSIVINSMVEDQVYIGDFCIIRNSVLKRGARIGGHCQLNWAIVQEQSELPHFNNVAYSIIGRRVLFGTCASTCSRRLDGRRPQVKLPNGIVIESKSDRIGALVGDDCRIGGHTTINPFAIIPKSTLIQPNTSVIGYFEGQV